MLIKVVACLLLFTGIAICSPTGRVVNGTNSDIAKYPFMVSLRYKGQHMCGCTILNPRWLLTAAHCLHDFDASDLSMQYGLTDVAIKGPNIIYPRRYILHWGYKHSGNFPNDIALIELNGQLIYNYKTIAPVQLPEENFEIADVPAVVAGWGLNATTGVPQITLQEANLLIIGYEECKTILKNPINQDHICAGEMEQKKGACSSDSGGPLIYNGSMQVGVVSWGEGVCGMQPDAYAKVSHYIRWIKSYIS